jgi:hypothetical protein
MSPLRVTAHADLVAVDLAVLSRARVVMHQLLLRCLQDPLNPEPLRAAHNIQQLLTDDVAAAQTRLRATLS